jgi:hypothetical protein
MGSNLIRVDYHGSINLALNPIADCAASAAAAPFPVHGVDLHGLRQS